jgi:[ribosomal protein S5]-alanine N-acetyltransferase
MASVELSTIRLRLRDSSWGTTRLCIAFATDLAVVSYVERGPNTPEETQAFLREARASADCSPRRRHAFAVVHSDAERLIGSIELRVVSFEHRRGEIGYVLAHEWWGQGYATEATRRLLTFGFDQLGLLRYLRPGESRFSCADEERHASGRSSSRPHLCPSQWRDRLLFSVIA